MLLLSIFAAFSFLLPDGGRLSEQMGFSYDNPALHQGGMILVGGELGTLDTKKATISISKNNVFVNANYINFGEIEVRGDIPDDEGALVSYPYLFSVEAGTRKKIGNTEAGMSISFYEQRVMEYSLSGYYFSFGLAHRISFLNLQAFVRNIGSRNGFMNMEKYSLPIFAYTGVSYSGKNDIASIGAILEELSVEDAVFSILYARRIYRKLWVGAEFLPEKDMSIGYRNRYPVRFMLKAVKKDVSFGYQVKVPRGALDFKHILYLGVRI